MKKIIGIFLILLIIFSFTACDTAKIKVGVKDGVAYFHHSQMTPEIILKGENEAVIEDESFFGKLISAIDGKPAVNDVCNFEAIYNIRIDKYTFGLHTHGITISWPMGKNIKGMNIFTVECTEAEMSELLDILESVR